MDTDELLAEQVGYYRARAAEYDDWWFRRGRYDNGPEWNQSWFAEVAEVESGLERFDASGDVLELACGTGLWTRYLARTAARLTAVDTSPEVIELNRARVGDASVEYVRADIFGLQLPGRYDACCFGFWLSHVPDERFAGFWDGVARALRPGGRVFFVDSGPDRSDRAHTYTRDRAHETELRQLSDGREFRIVKRYHEPPELERRLGELGFEVAVSTTARGSMIYGLGSHG
jgi:SAM-dependent methyltransferase